MHLDEEQYMGIHVLAASHVLKTLRATRHNKLNLRRKMHFV